MTLRSALLAVACGGLILAACAHQPAPVDSTKTILAWDADRACASDAECVAIEDCCPCASGGVRIAVAKASAAKVEARRAETCMEGESIVEPHAKKATPSACTATASNQSCSAGARPACRDAVCRLVL